MYANVDANPVEQEYLQYLMDNSWASVYQKLGEQCQGLKYSCNEARKPKNKTLNRYRDVSPYDHSRVILKRIPHDYINANFVTLERANRRYILTQGPLASTVSHFWLMIWEQKSKAILMLNKIIEKNEMKCHMYWPENVGDEERWDDVGLKVSLIKEENCDYYHTRLIRLYDIESETTRDIVQYHYTTWPDFGVPSSPTAFVRFWKRVRDSGVLDASDGPPVVHCSAGIGRSGTFCLVDCCLVIVEKEGMHKVNVKETLIAMRQCRMGLIQTPDQLRFTYLAILEGAKRLDPNWEEPEDEFKHQTEETVMADSVYSIVGDDEAPPPPPPRGASLAGPPHRSLPAIPASESLGDIKLSGAQESSSSDESRHSSVVASSASSVDEEAEQTSVCTATESFVEKNLPPPPVAMSRSSASSADDEAEELSVNAPESAGDTTETVRKRRNRELAARVSDMKKRAKETERWHAIKRSFYKPLTITFGFILAGIIIYAYVKH